MSFKIWTEEKKNSFIFGLLLIATTFPPYCRWMSFHLVSFPFSLKIFLSISYNAGGLVVTICPNFRLFENVFISIILRFAYTDQFFFQLWVTFSVYLHI